MPSPKKKSSVSANKKRLVVMYPSRGKSARIQSKIKEESLDDVVEPKVSRKAKTKSLKALGKSKKQQKKRKETPKMTVLMLAAARKRKLNGEDDTEPSSKRIKKKKVKKIKKKTIKRKEKSDEDDNEMDDHQLVAIKQDEGSEDDDDDDDDDDTEDNDEDHLNNLIIGDQDLTNEHHYVQSHETNEIEVPAEQVQAELQQQEDDDDDIDENLFFGIPEQQSPDLASCTHCKGKFRKEDVHEHMLTCPERYVQCRECGKILSNLQTLERHHKRFHLKIREVPCTLCDKMFIDEAAARKHLKTVHFKVKNFHCPHCDKSFSQRNKLTYHVRTHSGEKPYSCAECGRSFSLLWNLKTHLRTHTGEKPYACDTCGRRFTQKQNMTSHLTTHRKPKSEKGFRGHFPGELEDFETNSSGIISTDLAYKQPAKSSYRAFEQAKQLSSQQSLGSGHYVLGDMQSIEVRTEQDPSDVNLEHGLGLLSSVARKGDPPADVQVDGIVNMAENAGNMDQVVEVLIKSSTDADKPGNSYTTLQLAGASSNQSKIVIDPSTQHITDGDGQEIQLDSNTAAGLSNILQNPDVLAAINNAASTNKFIVIGPVSMFVGNTTSTSLTTSEGGFPSQDQLSTIPDESLVNGQVSSQTVNDSISASSALAAVEGYLQGEQRGFLQQSEQPSSSSSKGDEVVNNILGSIQTDTPAVVSNASNLTICMPPMNQSPLTITPSRLSIKADSTQRVLPSTQTQRSSEVSSSIDDAETALIPPDGNQLMTDADRTMEAESTTEYNLNNEVTYDGAADSSGLDMEASSSGEPILILSADENGQPQIIVKMPDGSETIMSDPALAESLIQVPTITNAEDGGGDHVQPSQSIHNNMQLDLPDQGIPESSEFPTQSEHFVTQSANQEFGSAEQLVSQSDQSFEYESQPDQSLDSASLLNNVDSTEDTQESFVSGSTTNGHSTNEQIPDSSSQSQRPVTGGEPGQSDVSEFPADSSSNNNDGVCQSTNSSDPDAQTVSSTET